MVGGRGSSDSRENLNLVNESGNGEKLYLRPISGLGLTVIDAEWNWVVEGKGQV